MKIAVDLTVVLAEIFGRARKVVDVEIAAMESLVLKLEKRERDLALARWPEGERWRELASADLAALKMALDALEKGEIVAGEGGRKVLLLDAPQETKAQA